MIVQATVRKRLALVFMILSGFIYFGSTGAGFAVFMFRLDQAIHAECTTIAKEVKAATSERNGLPVLVRPRAGFDLPASVQLYDANGKLVEQIGLAGVPVLDRHSLDMQDAAGQSFRSVCLELKNDRGVFGFAQIQVSLRGRDEAWWRYFEAVLFVAPLVVLGLTLSGHFFAVWAIRPIEQALSTLRAFLADAGHELGTPVAIMRNTSENLMLDVEGLPDAAERVEILVSTAERMSDLVKDMMLLSTLENPQLPMKKTQFDLDTLVVECARSFKDLYAAKNLTLQYDDVAQVRFFGNRSSMERLITNLLQNACKYTETGGVTICLHQKDSRVFLSVADTGIGIPAEAQPFLFDRFYRVDSARSREKGGFGLGLAIVRATAELHEGNIKVESAEGKGTKITIAMPTRTN